MKKFYKLFVIFLFLQNIDSKKKYRKVYFMDVKFTNSPKYIKQLEINVTEDNTALNFLLETSTDLAELWTSTAFSLYQPKSKTYRPMLNYDFDICNILSMASSVQIDFLNVWLTNMLRYGNMSRNCPVKKNLYYIRNLKSERTSIPDFAPSGRFRSSFLFYKKKKDNSKEDMCKVDLSFEIK